MFKKKVCMALSVTAASILMALSAPVSAFADTPMGNAGGWVNGAQGWWWQNPDGTYPASAWKEVKGLWYHFNPDGYVNLGWYKDSDGTWYYLDPTNGDMKTGWQNVGGLYYYMDPSGAMLHDATTPDGYKVNHDGVWVESKASSEDTTSKSSGSTGEIKDGEDGWLVYVAPKSGNKYHYDRNCRGLKKADSIEVMTESEAKAHGYGLCGYED